jgi:hypothetical protein
MLAHLTPVSFIGSSTIICTTLVHLAFFSQLYGLLMILGF